MSTDVGTWKNGLTFEPDPDHSPDAGTGLLSPISYALQPAEFYYVGKIPRTFSMIIRRLSQQRRVVLRHRKTVVGGKCAIPSAVLVYSLIMHLFPNSNGFAFL